MEGDVGVHGFAVLALFCLGFSEFQILKLGFAVFYSTAVCSCQSFLQAVYGLQMLFTVFRQLYNSYLACSSRTLHRHCGFGFQRFWTRFCCFWRILLRFCGFCYPPNAPLFMGFQVVTDALYCPVQYHTGGLITMLKPTEQGKTVLSCVTDHVGYMYWPERDQSLFMMKPTEQGMTVLTCVTDPWATCTGQGGTSHYL